MKPIFRSAMTFSVLIVAGGLLNSCTTTEAKDENPKPSPYALPAHEAFLLQKGSLSSAVQIPGELMAYHQVDLYAKISSFVKKLYVDVGSEVAAGQKLASLEAPEINSQLSAAASRLQSQEALYLASKGTYDRLLETSKTPGTISPNDLEVSYAKQKSDQAQLQAARAAYREINDNRNYLEVRAPFGGILTSRNVSAGAYVGPSGKGSEMPMFNLQEQRKLRLAVSVPEAYVSYLGKQSEVQFTVRSMPNEKFSAKVSRLAGALDSRLRSQRIEMDVTNNDKKLLPGMVAEVLIQLRGSSNAFIVPSPAVLNSTEGLFVIKVQNDKTVWVPVTTGRNSDGKTEIFGPLSQEDILIAHVTEEIRDGSPAVNIKINR
jgi:RND family efflux transporter MFP subunit